MPTSSSANSSDTISRYSTEPFSTSYEVGPSSATTSSLVTAILTNETIISIIDYSPSLVEIQPSASVLESNIQVPDTTKPITRINPMTSNSLAISRSTYSSVSTNSLLTPSSTLVTYFLPNGTAVGTYVVPAAPLNDIATTADLSAVPTGSGALNLTNFTMVTVAMPSLAATGFNLLDLNPSLLVGVLPSLNATMTVPLPDIIGIPNFDLSILNPEIVDAIVELAEEEPLSWDDIPWNYLKMSPNGTYYFQGPSGIIPAPKHSNFTFINGTSYNTASCAVFTPAPPMNNRTNMTAQATVIQVETITLAVTAEPVYCSIAPAPFIPHRLSKSVPYVTTNTVYETEYNSRIVGLVGTAFGTLYTVVPLATHKQTVDIGGQVLMQTSLNFGSVNTPSAPQKTNTAGKSTSSSGSNSGSSSSNGNSGSSSNNNPGSSSNNKVGGSNSNPGGNSNPQSSSSSSSNSGGSGNSGEISSSSSSSTNSNPDVVAISAIIMAGLSGGTNSGSSSSSSSTGGQSGSNSAVKTQSGQINGISYSVSPGTVVINGQSYSTENSQTVITSSGGTVSISPQGITISGTFIAVPASGASTNSGSTSGTTSGGNSDGAQTSSSGNINGISYSTGNSNGISYVTVDGKTYSTSQPTNVPLSNGQSLAITSSGSVLIGDQSVPLPAPSTSGSFSLESSGNVNGVSYSISSNSVIIEGSKYSLSNPTTTILSNGQLLTISSNGAVTIGSQPVSLPGLSGDGSYTLGSVSGVSYTFVPETNSITVEGVTYSLSVALSTTLSTGQRLDISNTGGVTIGGQAVPLPNSYVPSINDKTSSGSYSGTASGVSYTFSPSGTSIMIDGTTYLLSDPLTTSLSSGQTFTVTSSGAVEINGQIISPLPSGTSSAPPYHGVVNSLSYALTPSGTIVLGSPGSQTTISATTPTTLAMLGHTIQISSTGGITIDGIPILIPASFAASLSALELSRSGGPETIIANGMTLTIAGSTLEVGGKTYIIPVGSPVHPTSVVVNGDTISLGPNGIGLPSTTIELPTAQPTFSAITTDGVTFSLGPSDVVVVNGKTYTETPGAIPTTTTINGHVISIGPHGVGLADTIIALISPTPTTLSAAALSTEKVTTIDGIVFTLESGNRIVLDGKTFTETLGSHPTTTVINGHTISLGPNGIGFAETIVGLIPSLTAKTIDGITVYEGAGDIVVINGHTYTEIPGASPITIVINRETISIGPKGIGFPKTTVPLIGESTKSTTITSSLIKTTNTATGVATGPVKASATTKKGDAAKIPHCLEFLR
ncbi:MAG: hypothetical protein M1834_006263 [Cirrosporium novae-zelandiae]|nr:MAG: hypothetical protein M1834_006263 [Cirrosporium novae-zelandiae]